MEDQPTDSGDLTTDAAAPVPQGKSARTRHRLPRQKLRQEGQDGTTEESTEEATEVVAEAEAEVETEAADTEIAEPETAVVEPAAPRRRFRWRRSKTVEQPIAAESEITESFVEVPESSTETTEPETKAAEDTESAEDTEVSGASGEEPDEQAEPEEPPVLVPHRTAGLALKVTAIVAGILFVGAAAFAGSTMQPYLADRAAAQTKFEIAETAAKAITTLWTYTPEDMDGLPDRAGKFLSGDFASEYRRYIDAIVETNKQAQVTNNTQVLGAAVESLAPTEASAIVYTNSVATSPVTKGIPSLRYLSYRLTMELRNREWLITKMTAVTSLDLTPKL
ncbi:mammalian cell entry protein [Mycobacterium sp. AZCC_0083]|uniref:mammalian cell entry protein n=1 Tax=Mycobacterium sp. AZCC_0083 TaxID=2735882 RepID=UPI00160D4C90|nr:mammalian cell entry protein [Mycobacterium sp. AZCC_0083]MBB5163342.1 Mce-associated membrane protein [Mycobacterium sp. AZCC_0083]